MLIDFSVRNFRSLRDEVFLSLRARGQGKLLQENRATPVGCAFSVLKSSVIYGANASGKSNLFRAAWTMRSAVLAGGLGTDFSPAIRPFLLDESSRESPTRFEMEFVSEGIRYRYGFACKEHSVMEEWLYRQRRRMTVLFARNGERFVASSPECKEVSLWKTLLKKSSLRLSGDTLFLPMAAHIFAGGDCARVFQWFQDELQILSAEEENFFIGRIADAIRDPQVRQRVSDFVSSADTGVHTLETVSGGETLLVNAHHKVGGKDYALDLFADESSGTRKVFALSLPILDSLEKGRTLFVDELDAKLHPLLVSGILEKFHACGNNAQILLTAHSPAVLTETSLRHDQVWFAEKSREDSSTRLHSLADYRGIRGNFGTIARDYMHGCYGGIPILSRFGEER